MLLADLPLVGTRTVSGLLMLILFGIELCLGEVTSDRVELANPDSVEALAGQDI